MPSPGVRAQRQVSPHPGEARGSLRWVGVVRAVWRVPCGHGARQHALRPQPPPACGTHTQAGSSLPDAPLILCCSVAQSSPTLCDPRDCSTPGSLSSTISQSLLKLMSIESVMPSNHLILCRPLLLPSLMFPSIRGLFFFSSESALRIRAKVLEFQLQHQSFQ